MFAEKKLEFETPGERKEDKWKKDLIELLEHCENFELRISVLEGNCNEKFRELFKKLYTIHDNVQNQPDNPKIERKITTLLETVKKFNASLETKDAELEKDMKIVKGKIEMVQSANKNLGTQIQMVFNAQYGPPPVPPMAPGAGVLPVHVPNAYIGQPLITNNLAQQPYFNLPPPTTTVFNPMTLIPPQTVPSVTPATSSTSSVEKNERIEKEQLLIPEYQYNFLVGRAGITINQIREKSGATIIISLKNKTDTVFYLVHIHGSTDQINKAKEMINSVLNPFPQKNLNISKPNTEKSPSGTFQYNFGVQVECEDPTLKNCQCKIHDVSIKKQNENMDMDISMQVELQDSEFGKMVIENVEKSLGLPEEGFKSTKAVLYKGSFLTCEFQIDLKIDEISKLQVHFKDLCTVTFKDANQEFPILKEPTSITNHKLLLTYVQSFNQDRSQGVKKLLNRPNLMRLAPLFILPKLR